MTITRTADGLLALTSQKSAHRWSAKFKIARNRITAIVHTTASRNSTTPTSTRPSSVLPISRWGARLVNTRSIARLLTTKVNSQLNWSKSMILIWTTTCFTLKLCGVLIARMTTTVRSASMRTTGKTSVEGLQLSLIQARCVQIGRWITSSALIQKGVKASISAYTRMAGRNKNTIPTSSKLSSVSTGPTARSHTAPTSTATMTGKFPCPSGLAFSPRHVLQPFIRIGI